MSEDALDKTEILNATQTIVAAHLGNNQVPTAEVPNLISAVMRSLTNGTAEAPPKEPLRPAVGVNRSITPDALICLECGTPYKSLKRHLKTHHNLSPSEYRARWGLSDRYPMVAPNYAKERSALALKAGLGHRPAAKAAE